MAMNLEASEVCIEKIESLTKKIKKLNSYNTPGEGGKVEKAEIQKATDSILVLTNWLYKEMRKK